MSDEEHVDIDPCDRDEPGESKTAKDAVKAAAGKVAVQAAAGVDVGKEETMANFLELVAENKKLKEDLAAKEAQSAKKRAPKGAHKAKCDDALEKIKPTIKYIEDRHKDEHVDLFLLGLFVKDLTDALPESDDHDAFKHWLTDNKLSIGLKKQTRKSVTPAASPAVSKNVSRAASAALGIAFEDDEEDVAGAK